MKHMTVKKGDTVLVITGKERGKKGVVEAVSPTRDSVLVAGVNIVKRHVKPNKNQPRGGIVEKSASLNRSKTMVVCPHCDKPTRVAMTLGENGTKYRTCKFCSGSLDTK